MERLSFDVDHIQRSEILRRHKPSRVSEGLRNGLSGLGLSILGLLESHVNTSALPLTNQILNLILTLTLLLLNRVQ